MFRRFHTILTAYFKYWYTPPVICSGNIPDAFFTVSDEFAVAALSVARDFNYKVPEDIIVVGFDNTNLSLMSYPTITTISQPRYQIGYTAGELLFEKINNPNQPVRNILFNTELIVRGSSIMENSPNTIIRTLTSNAEKQDESKS